MSPAVVHWTDLVFKPAPPLSRERLAEVQQRLGVTFPEDYLEVVRRHQGAAPDRGSVTRPDGTGTIFNLLLHMEDEPEALSILGVIKWSEILPDRVIPFAIDPGSDYFCFDYRATDIDPPVVFMPTDDSYAEPEFLANSFTELIDSL